RARACGRRGRRSCDRPSPGRRWMCATTCGASASTPTCSSSGSSRAAALPRTAPSCWICSPLLLAASAAPDDQFVRFLVLRTRALAERRHAPRRHGVTSALRLALAAAVRVVDRVHRRAADGGPLAEPAAAPCLAAGAVAVIDVADLSDRGAAGQQHPAHLTRGQTERRV